MKQDMLECGNKFS